MKQEEFETHFLLVNKPKGWTSFDVVGYVRKTARYLICHPELVSGSGGILETRLTQMLKQVQHDKQLQTTHLKVGHAGTLDPFATGLLIIGVGREATKRLDEFKSLSKTYVAKLRLGMVSDTMDSSGRIENFRFVTSELPNDNDNTPNLKTQIINQKSVQNVLTSFLGKQLQIPPMFSAKQINGVRLYKLARQGVVVERQPSEIEIYRLSLVAYEWPHLTIEVECSAGTYIRTLANDIGEKLRVGAYCEELTRTRIGDYTVEKALSINSL